MDAMKLVRIVGLGAGVWVSGCGNEASAPAVTREAARSAANGGADGSSEGSVRDAGAEDEVLRPCVRNSDCPVPRMCREVRTGVRACVPQCREDFDCCANPGAPCGRVCRAERCVAGDAESCNGRDDDADGETDEGFNLMTDAANCGRCGLACDAVLSHARPGGATCAAGVCRLAVDGCAEGFHNTNGSDADGCEYGCHPTNGGIEEPDGDDNDCDGAADEGFACARGVTRPCGAGTGICSEGVQACLADGTWSACAGAVGARTEVCNMLDDDCNGVADDGIARGPEQCDAARVDEDCDGEVNEGCDCTDGDDRPCGIPPALHGVGICRFGVQTCIGGQWGACLGGQAPLPVELCNMLDDNCDGAVALDEADDDVDGYMVCADDCDDRNPFVNPNAEDLCDDRDDDCDGQTDEDFFVGAPCRGIGACAEARGGILECANPIAVRCSLDFGGSAYAGTPETPNGRDDDCDGIADNGFICRPEAQRPCGLDSALHGIGSCRVGVQMCGADGAWSVCGGAVAPTTETCNGLDDDCNGRIPPVESDRDRDGVRRCAGDCDDENAAVFPDAAESCNGLDDDCNGRTDEDFFVGVPCDGVGACGRGVYECDGPAAFRCSTNPGGSAYAPAREICDRVDNDCDGIVDADVDAAAVAGDPANCGACGITCASPNAVVACVAGVCAVTGCADGFWFISGSCLRCDVWPMRPETCDAGFLDDDCDGVRNEDCACINGTAQPCGVDPELHGVGSCRVGVQTCAEGRWGACAGAIAPNSEVCNMLDDDCDGAVPLAERDGDRDGVRRCAGDCDDENAGAFPGADEVCNGLDDDCDGRTDEDSFVGVPCDGVGACGRGVYECDGTRFGFRCSTDPRGSEHPDPSPFEVCDNLADDDCDGSVDEGCGECVPGTERPCGVAPSMRNVGECRVGVQACGTMRTWGICVGAVAPTPENCNGRDDDCDGVTDDSFDLATDPAHCGACGNDCSALANVADAVCAAGMCDGFTCRPGFHDVDGDPDDGCEYGCFPTKGGTEVENCDGVDNDCDGMLDEDPSCRPPLRATRAFTFAITLPDTAACPLDATAALCGTMDDRVWSCGDYALARGGSDLRTLTASGMAVTGFHQIDLCIADCDTPTIAKWAVFRDGATGLIVECALPTVTFNGAAVGTRPVPNASGGGAWATDEFRAP